MSSAAGDWAPRMNTPIGEKREPGTVSPQSPIAVAPLVPHSRRRSAGQPRKTRRCAQLLEPDRRATSGEAKHQRQLNGANGPGRRAPLSEALHGCAVK